MTDDAYRRLRKRVMRATGPVKDLLLRRYLREKARRGRWDERFCGYYGVSSDVTRECRRAIMRGYAIGLVPTSTTGGGHAPGSWHYKHRAVDMGNRRLTPQATRDRRMRLFQTAEFSRPWEELLGPINNLCRLKGRPVTLAEGTALENQHDNHVHVADSS